MSYDGFDETEQTEFPTMLEETEKIEAYLRTHCGGHIRAAYGCSLGGLFVGLLAARGHIRMDCGILGSSDLDQASKLTARLETALLMPLMYPSGTENSSAASCRNGWRSSCRRRTPMSPHF